MKRYVFILAFICGCADKDPIPFNPLDASQIAGFWRSEFNPAWSYWFTSDGVLIQREIIAGAEVQRNEYTYRTAHDSVFCEDIFTGNRRLFTVYFDSDTAATLTENIQGFIFKQQIKKK